MNGACPRVRVYAMVCAWARARACVGACVHVRWAGRRWEWAVAQPCRRLLRSLWMWVRAAIIPLQSTCC